MTQEKGVKFTLWRVDRNGQADYRLGVKVPGLIAGCVAVGAGAAFAGEVTIVAGSFVDTSLTSATSVDDADGAYDATFFSTATALVDVDKDSDFDFRVTLSQATNAMSESFVQFTVDESLDYTFTLNPFLAADLTIAEFGTIENNIESVEQSFAFSGGETPFTGTLVTGTTYFLRAKVQTVGEGSGIVDFDFSFQPFAAVPLPQPFVMASVGIGLVALRRRR